MEKGADEMKTVGMTRRVDPLGRIVIPKEIRDANGWEAGTLMELEFTKGGLLIKAYEDSQKRQGLVSELEGVISSMNDDEAKAALNRVIQYLDDQRFN